MESVYFREICTVSIVYYIPSNDSFTVLKLMIKNEDKGDILIYYNKNTNILKKKSLALLFHVRSGKTVGHFVILSSSITAGGRMLAQVF